MAHLPHASSTNERSNDNSGEAAWQTAKYRNDGPADEQQWRNKRHQQQVLHHVRTEQCISESVERRGYRQPDDGDAKEERQEAPL